MTAGPSRLGLFSRLVRPNDTQDAASVYRDALEQIALAERLGYDTAWVAQHHIDAAEGGLPSPFVFLAHVAARCHRIRLGTAIVTLALEDPIRVAEDAAVLDALSDGRLELGFGAGGSASSFELFGVDGYSRTRTYATKLERVTAAFAGEPLAGARTLHPPAAGLRARTWQATFSGSGAVRAGAAGDGLLLSRSQPRDPHGQAATLVEIQQPLLTAYRAALPAGVTPRIGASRSVFVADDHHTAWAAAQHGARRFLDHLRDTGATALAGTVDEVLRDSYIGTPDEVAEQLAADTVVAQATDLIVQVHPIDPGQAATLRSIELLATEVVPRLRGTSSIPTGDFQ
ncbi:putative FMN-dependent luciferase-like monooxygenase [Nocardia stercoris]|uniref:Putative FMN-dependent luciferase-like monooxygenase n=1 Tax=Nocardia stercoris TaxID=2483361 RepID=A0A3M2LFK5_9NOCA|nr:putative FMN-dependent luciferase-like monooxygenase [Nocardia stercoris]RMI35610.1 putative FMN-dependent luciferase-like monooxygenase [Nocardia stercoris]